MSDDWTTGTVRDPHYPEGLHLHNGSAISKLRLIFDKNVTLEEVDYSVACIRSDSSLKEGDRVKAKIGLIKRERRVPQAVVDEFIPLVE